MENGEDDDGSIDIGIYIPAGAYLAGWKGEMMKVPSEGLKQGLLCERRAAIQAM